MRLSRQKKHVFRSNILYNGTTSILKPCRVSKIFTVHAQKYLNIYKNVEVIIFNFETKIIIKLSEIIDH